MSELIATDVSQVVTSVAEQLVTLTVDNQVFGIPILAIQDIVEPLKITPVPLAPSDVAGVINLRGRIVIDLRHCLGDLQSNIRWASQSNITIICIRRSSIKSAMLSPSNNPSSKNRPRH